MSMLFNRTAIVPMWLVVFGLFVMFESPMTFATGVVLFLVAGVALTIMLVASKELHTLVPMTPPVPRLPALSSNRPSPRLLPTGY